MRKSAQIQPATVKANALPSDVTSKIVDSFFQWSLLLLIAIGFLMLASTGRLDAFAVMFVASALLFRGFLLATGRTLLIPERWTSILGLVYVLIFVTDLFLISGNYVSASIHLVLFSLVVKLFSVYRDRDYLYLAVLAFLAVLAASVLTINGTFVLLFCLFVLIAVSTFISMEMRRSLINTAHRAHMLPAPQAERRLVQSLSATAIAIVIGIVVSATVVFFALPRFSVGYLNLSAPRDEFSTGFSDKVRLGEIGRIQQSNAVVMHVQIEGRAPATDLYWRGIALSKFDGKSWQQPPSESGDISSPQGRYALRVFEEQNGNLSPRTTREEYSAINYTVLMEPIGTNVIFLASFPVQLTGRFRLIQVDESGSVFNTDRSRIADTYQAVSLTPRPGVARKHAQAFTGGFAGLDAYLNAGDVDPRVPELARRVTAGARSDYDRAAFLEHYLRTNLAYTLELPSTPPPDPIATFLFDRRKGHCEYFASAMAIMLRTLGIPSRVVNGFHMGEFNPITNSYIVRARDAHTWVEAYFPGAGWTTFDPTPIDLGAAPNSWNRVQLYFDAVQQFWREWVVSYDFGHQRLLGTLATNKTQHWFWDFGRWMQTTYDRLLQRARSISDRVSRGPGKWAFGAIALLVLTLILWNARRLWIAFRQHLSARDPANAPVQAASVWYGRMLRHLGRRGFPKQPGQTPSEFVEAIPQPELKTKLARFTAHYEQARFGASPEDAERLPELYEEITSN